ncbi:MAG: response regulator [Oscillospiraceae bacterium]|nr:response regulator [Oscillospiraceae bacterium]
MEQLRKILIAEDELMIRQGIKYLVDWERHGFEVVAVARNGQEALKMIEETRPDIIITDILMPVMNGIELIKEISRLYPEIHVIVLSGYSDFEYVKNSFRFGAIDYILKPSLKPDELLSAVIKAAKLPDGVQHCADNGHSIEHLLGRLLSGRCPPEVSDAVTARFPAPSFLLFGADVESFAAPARMDSFLSSLDAIEPDFMHDVEYERIVFDGWVLIYIINIGKDKGGDCGTDPKIENELAKFAESAGGGSPEIFFVCGNRFEGAENIGPNYRDEFARRLRERFYYKNERYMHVSDFEKPDRKKGFKISELSKLLSIGSFDKSISLLSERFTLIVNNRYMDELDLKTLAQNAMYQLISVMDEILGPIPKLESLKARCLTRISKARFAEDFISDFKVSLDEISSILREIHDNPNESVMPRILAYIDEHYAEELTLSHLASWFNLNYNYLSAYFGTNYAEGFSKHLARVRIEKAKEQLSETDMPVSDICTHVGFSDHSYFTRVFRKYVGSTPSSYRAKMKKSRHDRPSER